MAKTYQSSVFKEIVDRETGEIISTEQTKVFTKKVTSENFYMTFVDYISPLFNLKGGNCKSILVWLCSHAEYNTGKVSLTASDRQKIGELLNISNNTITNNIKILKDNKIISGEKGSFILNPQIHWKGDTETRRRLLQNQEIKITFSIE